MVKKYISVKRAMMTMLIMIFGALDLIMLPYYSNYFITALVFINCYIIAYLLGDGE